MKRILIATLSALFIAHSLSAISTPPGWLSDLDAGMKLAKESNQLILLDIYIPTCPYCKKLHKEVYPDEEFKSAAKNFIKVSLNGENNLDVVERFDVRGTPTIVFLDKNGYVLKKFSGYAPKDEFIKIMNHVSKNSNPEENVISALKKNPNSVSANYAAGLYYADSGKHEEARKYFIKAWNAPSSDNDNKRNDAMYNAAVSSMQLSDFKTAISQWTAFLGVYKEKDSDHGMALFYRGVSSSQLGDKKSAVKDIEAAMPFLPEEARHTAEHMLKDLK